jgi:hypothetical protein
MILIIPIEGLCVMRVGRIHLSQTLDCLLFLFPIELIPHSGTLPCVFPSISASQSGVWLPLGFFRHRQSLLSYRIS